MKYETIGELIAALAEEREMTAYRLARLALVNENYVRLVLLGEVKNVGEKNLAKMLSVLAPGKTIRTTFELIDIEPIITEQ
jgi:hypothetical protein